MKADGAWGKGRQRRKAEGKGNRQEKVWGKKVAEEWKIKVGKVESMRRTGKKKDI